MFEQLNWKQFIIWWWIMIFCWRLTLFLVENVVHGLVGYSLWRCLVVSSESFKPTRCNMPQFGSLRVTVVSAAVGLALIGALALLFRRRRRRRAMLYHDIYLESPAGKNAIGHGKVELGDGDRLRKKNARLTSSNGGNYCSCYKPLKSYLAP